MFESGVCSLRTSTKTRPGQQNAGRFLFVYLVWFDSLCPCQQFFSLPGRVFLGRTSTKQRIKCLAQTQGLGW